MCEVRSGLVRLAASCCGPAQHTSEPDEQHLAWQDQCSKRRSGHPQLRGHTAVQAGQSAETHLKTRAKAGAAGSWGMLTQTLHGSDTRPVQAAHLWVRSGGWLEPADVALPITGLNLTAADSGKAAVMSQPADTKPWLYLRAP